MTEIIQLAGEDIEQNFGIGGGVDVAAFFFKQLLTQLVGIGQVAIMGQRNAVGRVNVKRLRFRSAGTACRWVTDVANPHISLHTLHVARFEHIAHQPVSFTQTEAVICINGDDARGILPTMLKHR